MVEWGYSEEEGEVEEEGGRKRKMFKEEEKMYCGEVRRWR